MTGRQAVVKALYEAPEPRPIHALEVPGVSQATVSAWIGLGCGNFERTVSCRR